MKEFAKEFYKSQAWKNTSTQYRQSVGGLCERCKAKGLITPAEIVHHKIHITPHNILDESITLDWNNLEALCRECHGEEHRSIVKRYKFDESGRLIPTDPPD